METRNLICINCPMGCALTVEMNRETIISVKGNTCRRGETYAGKEVTAPVRMVTSTVKVTGGSLPVVSVKTREAVPKEKILACVRELKTIEVPAPVRMGDVILADAANTGVDIIATKNVEAIAFHKQSGACRPEHL